MLLKPKSLAGLVAAACLAAAALPAQALLVSLNPSATTVAVGGSVTVDVVISGLSAAGDIVSAYDLDILFDPSVLTATAATNDPSPWQEVPTDDPGFFSDLSTPGQAFISLLSFLDDATLDSIQNSDSIVLATLTFQGVADGSTSIFFGASPAFARNVIGFDAETLAADFGSTCISVGTGSCNQVPEPATYGLVALALAGMVPALRRRPASAAARSA
jgi:hypothetical protein